MSLKYEIESLEGIPEALHTEYTKGDDGKFRLGVEGLPQPKAISEDTAGLKKKVDELLAEKKKADSERKKAEDAARAAAEESARKSGDVQAIEKSWQEKLAASLGEKDTEIKRLDGSLRNVLVESVAKGIAGDLAITGSANVLLPHIRARLAVDYVDGEPMTRVLDAHGKPSAATLDDLKAEFAASAAFAPIIAGTKASGGGAAGVGRGGAGVKNMKRSDFNALPPHKQSEIAQAVRKGEVTLSD